LTTWSDIWLTTGFATYAQWLWAEKSGGDSTRTQARAAMARLAALPADLVLSDPDEKRMLDPRVSLRGACLLEALRIVMGDQTFFQLLTLWAGQSRGGTATTGDFLQTVSNAYNAQNMVDFLDSWLYRPALPSLSSAPTPPRS
jgi:aminopeptidase N